MAAHRRDVEPFVRLNEIDRDARAGGMNHAARETVVCIRRLGTMPASKSHVSHYGLPICFAAGADPQTAPNRIPVARTSGQARSSGENLNDSLNVAMNRT
jgi:hypothetical protein